MRSTVAEAVVVLGCALTLLSAVGVIRFRDPLSRLHALTKAAALGMLLVLLGTALSVENADDVTSLVLAAMLQLLTLPVGANLISRSAYRTSVGPPVDAVDELAAAEEAGEV